MIRQQVPMVSLLLLVYLGAVAYISVEISLGLCWRWDILRVNDIGKNIGMLEKQMLGPRTPRQLSVKLFLVE